MCYSTYHIKNPSKNWQPTDPLFYDVPCGHCGQCRTEHQRQFQIRAYYEFLRANQCGGYTMMQGFTYNERFVPREYGILCFNPEDIRLFRKRMREYLESLGFNPEIDYKVIFCSEYGGETHRPHWHSLWHVYNPKLTLDILINAQELLWSQVIETDKGRVRIPMGYTDTNNPDPEKCCTRVSRKLSPDKPGFHKGIMYVTKYVCKDFDWLEVVNNQKGRSKFGYYGPDPSTMSRKDKNKFFPCMRISKGYGACITDMVDFNTIVDGKLKLPDSEKGEVLVHVPQYIDRKLFYDYDKETKSFYLNELGLCMKSVRDLHNRNYVEKHLRFCLDNCQQLWSESFSQLTDCHDVIKYRNIQDWMDWKIEFNIRLAGRSLSDLSTYIYTYRDVCDIAPFDPLPLPEVLLRARRERHLTNCTLTFPRVGNPDFGRLEYLGDSEDTAVYRGRVSSTLYVEPRIPTYGHTRLEFKDFDYLVEMVNDLYYCYCNRLQTLYIERKREESRQKSVFYSS